MNNSKTIVKNRTRAIQQFLKAKDITRLERETALLAFDVLGALEARTLSLKEADKLFTDIGYRIGPDVEKKTSEEFSMLLAEAMLLDEVGKEFGPDLHDIRNLATQILTKDRSLVALTLPRARAPV